MIWFAFSSPWATKPSAFPKFRTPGGRMSSPTLTEKRCWSNSRTRAMTALFWKPFATRPKTAVATTTSAKWAPIACGDRSSATRPISYARIRKPRNRSSCSASSAKASTQKINSTTSSNRSTAFAPSPIAPRRKHLPKVYSTSPSIVPSRAAATTSHRPCLRSAKPS